MITYDMVPLHKVIKEMSARAPSDYADVMDGKTPDVDWNSYLSASYAGHCLVVTARDNGELVGYASFTIGHNLRDKNVLEANSEGLYVEKSYRKDIGQQIINEADDFLQKLGVKETFYTNSNEAFGRLLERKGYEPRYKIWSVKYGQ